VKYCLNPDKVKILYMGFYNCLVILVQTIGMLFYDKGQIVFCDVRLALSATPPRPSGVRFRHESHNGDKI
jgi:hypothetical protein